MGVVLEPGPAVGGDRLADGRRQPGWPFHLGLVVVVLPLLWASSSPVGGGFVLWGLTGVLLLAAAVVWVGWLLAWSRRRPPGRESGRRFLLAPIGAVAFVVVLALLVPMRVRWLLAQDDFEALGDVAAATEPDASPFQPVEVDGPDRVGSFAVDRVVRVGEDVFVFLDLPLGSGGPFLMATGFAHLPGGLEEPLAPGGQGYDRVEATHLWGDWYVWWGYW